MRDTSVSHSVTLALLPRGRTELFVANYLFLRNLRLGYTQKSLLEGSFRIQKRLLRSERFALRGSTDRKGCIVGDTHERLGAQSSGKNDCLNLHKRASVKQ